MSIALNSVFVSGFESRSLQYEIDPTIPPTITKPFQTQSGQRTHHKDQSISLSFINVQKFKVSEIAIENIARIFTLFRDFEANCRTFPSFSDRKIANKKRDEKTINFEGLQSIKSRFPSIPDSISESEF